MAMKDHENIEQKFDRGFQIRPKKKLVNFFPAGEKGQILNFIGLFCLKGKLAEPKVLTGV